MKSVLSKQNIPLVFLVFISLFWSFYYTSNNWFNGFGSEKYEWWLIIDIFITIPLVCYFCLKDNLTKVLIKSLAYMSLLVLLGSYIIPTEQKHLWLYLQDLRYVVIGLVILFEAFVITSVVFAIKSAFNKNQDPDLAISQPLEKYLGKSVATALMQFDIRLWSFALFAKRIKSENYVGKKHFYCHLKDGVQSFFQGFIFLIIFEIPLVHLLLHFIWSPMAANIVSALTIFSLAFLVAEYRAIAKRPVSITNNCLIIRYGLKNPLIIKLADIEYIELNKKMVGKNKEHKIFNALGIPNVKIKLHESAEYDFKYVYLGLNNPTHFIEYIFYA